MFFKKTDIKIFFFDKEENIFINIEYNTMPQKKTHTLSQTQVIIFNNIEQRSIIIQRAHRVQGKYLYYYYTHTHTKKTIEKKERKKKNTMVMSIFNLSSLVS